MKKTFILIALLTVTLSWAVHPNCDQNRNFTNYTYKEYEYTRADSITGFDILNYDISITIDDDNEYISGAVITTVLAESNMSEIIFELEGLNVENILVNDTIADYTYSNGLITIDLENIESGDIFTTTVEYSGSPQLCYNPYPLGMFFVENEIYTISDPNASRYWWPCYDHPWDKAEVDLHITVRSDWEVAANGIRTGIDVNSDGTRTHHWDGSNPMATYLVSLVIRDFAELNDMYNDIPIHNFVYPSHETNAIEDLSNLPFMMETFSQLYGEYPFEKYGNAIASFSTYGAMEHQTMTTLSSYMIDGNHGYEQTIAHELAHQWFGNCLTCLTWKDIWLSEGFATYSEAIYTEHWQGYDAMINYVQSNIQGYYKNWAGNTAYTTYDPPYSSIFNPSTYEKPASVLHMLRLLVGTDTFFDILQTYFQTYKNGNVITEDFIQVAEDVSGMDLQHFFQQWIYESGLPKIDYAYFISNDPNIPQIVTYAKSTCVNANTEFEIVLPVHVNYTVGYDSLQINANPEITETVAQISSINYESVEFDPDSWILNRGYYNHTVNIDNAFASDSSVLIFWENSWEELDIQGYNIYRSTSESGPFEKLNDDLIAESHYEDLSVENNQTYFYRLKAVTNDIYETPFSDIFEATPIDFPLDSGILVIDETRDGNGQPGNPDDAMVDDFYSNIIPCEFTSFDYNQDGDLSLEFISNYSTIIWHDDDASFNYINNEINNLGCYIAAGGNLIISGLKTAATIEEYFLRAFLGSDQVDLVQEFIFNQANSDVYNSLDVDPDKVNEAFNGCLAYVATFPETENSVFTFQSAEGSAYDGLPIAMESNPNGKFILLGFPLYFMQEDQASEFIYTLLDNLEELDSNEETIFKPEIVLNAYPNPFIINHNNRGIINISYNLPSDSEINLSVFNSKGQKIATIFQGYQPAGEYIKSWNAQSYSSSSVSSGVYFYKLTTDKSEAIGKLIIIK
jgi:hypothetical protein